jgi:putative ABC transport system permease protein
MTIANLSWKNILAKPLNSFMSILLFALSIGLITFMLLFNDQLKKGLDSNLAGIDMVIGAKGSPVQMIFNSMYHIDDPTGNIRIQEVSSLINPKHPLVKKSIPLSSGDNYGSFRIIGTTPDILNLYEANEVKGEIFKEDFEVVIGSIVSEKLKMQVGDYFFSTHGLMDDPQFTHDEGSPFIVKGILPLTGTVLDQLILCTPQTIWKVHEHDSLASNEHHDKDRGHIKNSRPLSFHPIDTLQVRMLSDSIIADLRRNPDKEITSVLLQFKNNKNIHVLNMPRNINQNTNVMAASPAFEISRVANRIGTGADVVKYMAIIISIVAAISIFISLYTSLKERRYEMALLRVAGGGPSKIFQMIMLEGLWIAVMGLGLGLLIGHAGMHFTGSILEKSYRYEFTGALWLMEEVYIIIGAILIGLLASIIPALQGSKTDLHTTLAAN